MDGFSSPIVAQTGKVKQYVTFLSKGVVGVDAKTGRFLWRYDKTTDVAAIRRAGRVLAGELARALPGVEINLAVNTVTIAVEP